MAEWGISEIEMQTVINAGALEIILEAINAGVSQTAARKWWTGELSRIANDRGVELDSLSITAAHLLRIETLIAEGSLNDKLARQVIDGLLSGETDVDAVVAKRGLAVVSDDGPLIEAIDAALAADPEVAEKIKSGKLQAAGAVVGAVMKATRGQADASRVRELLFERLGVSEQK
jgi:aspartyl-tRNA(Asn)/glutamyl-tRNA(Gln) amidotransferase subunit B